MNATNGITRADFSEVLKPLQEAQSLPPWAYTSEDFYRLERKHVFNRVWNFVGHESRIPKLGDHYPVEIAGSRIIIVRGDDDQIHALSNSCRHRGTLLVEEPANRSRFVCPYHGWTYSLSGELIAPHADMARNECFDPAEHGLKPVRLESWAGFQFVNFDPNADSLDAYLGDLKELLAPYTAQRLIFGWRKTYDVACNWKSCLENLRDQLHLATVHRKSFEATVPSTTIDRTPILGDGNYSAAFIGSPRSTALLDDEPGFPLMEGLEGKNTQGTYTPLIYPGVYLGCTLDCVYYVHFRPAALTRSYMEVGVGFPADILQRDDFETTAARYYHTFLTIMDEDNPVLERQFLGLSSPLAVPGRFSRREEGVHHAIQWLVRRVIDGVERK